MVNEMDVAKSKAQLKTELKQVFRALDFVSKHLNTRHSQKATQVPCKTMRLVIASVHILLFGITVSASSLSFAAESRPAWQAEWNKTIKAAEEEGALVIYMTQAFEPVFRETFQKKYPKIKVTMVTGRGPELSQRVMSERRAEKFAVDLYVSGNISPLTVFHRAKILEPIKPLLLLPEVVDTSGWYEAKHHYDDPKTDSSSSSKARRAAARSPTIPNW